MVGLLHLGNLLFTLSLSLLTSVAESLSDLDTVYLKLYQLNWIYDDEMGQWKLDSLSNDYSIFKQKSKDRILLEIPYSELEGLLPFLRKTLFQYRKNAKELSPEVTFASVRRPTEIKAPLIHALHRVYDDAGLSNKYIIFNNYYLVFLLDKNPLSDEEAKPDDFFTFYPDGTVGRSNEIPPLNFEDGAEEDEVEYIGDGVD